MQSSAGAGAPASAPAPAAAQEGSSQPPAPAGDAAPTADNENVNLFEAAAAAAANRGSSSAPSRPAPNPDAEGALGLDFLRNNPQFQQLRRLVQESPQMLEPILQQVGQGNPQLAALISQNPEAFLQLLSEGASEGDAPASIGISVTPEEAEAIDRVSLMAYLSTSCRFFGWLY